MRTAILPFIALAIIAFSSTAQHNYLVSGPSSSSLFIRDVALTERTTVLSAFDVQFPYLKQGGIAEITSQGAVKWAKVINVPNHPKTYCYDVIQHPNGSIYAHGLTLDQEQQKAFLLKLSKDGKLLDRFFFDLGETYYHAINKVELLQNGDFLFFFAHHQALSIVRMSPQGAVRWGKTLSRRVFATGKTSRIRF